MHMHMRAHTHTHADTPGTFKVTLHVLDAHVSTSSHLMGMHLPKREVARRLSSPVSVENSSAVTWRA